MRIPASNTASSQRRRSAAAALSLASWLLLSPGAGHAGITVLPLLPGGAPLQIPSSPPPAPTSAPAAPAKPASSPVTPPQGKAGPAADAPIRIAALDDQRANFARLPQQPPFEIVSPNANPDLIWDPATRNVIVGVDIIARDVDVSRLPAVIERALALRFLAGRTAETPQPIRLTPNLRVHHKGERVSVEVQQLAGRNLLMFNIAGDGTVEMIYPLGSDAPMVSEDTYRVELSIREPLGADTLVAVSSLQAIDELVRRVKALDRRRNPARIVDLIPQFSPPDALVGVAAIFTAQ